MTPRARRIAACFLAAGALLAGCSTTTDGPRPTAAEPTEPSFPTPRPSRSTPPSPTPPPSPTTQARVPAGAEALPPEDGYVFIETKSGKTRCQVSAEDVGCEAQFTNAPEVDGAQANGVRVTAGGQVEWIVGNLGDIPTVTLDYRTYTAEGWTIEATEAGTRFTNDATGHGAFVAVARVDVF